MSLRACSLFVLALAGLAPFAAAAEVDQSPLPVKLVRAFPKLRPTRPVVMTNAGDGSNRLFLCTQQGIIHVIPNDQAVEETKTFLDLTKKVVYKDKENEEGLLGLAFHPKYKENGQFFLYYTSTAAPHLSVLSRFRVSQDDPNRADPASEEELLRVPQPFWNHNGGGIAFGPDGYLYIGLGDGGSGGDPMGNGQNRATLLGSILRIDIDRKDEGKAYAIPKDNPFVGQEKAAPEIFAYGFRNPWGLSFDKKSGLFYVADVGQDLWEEIDLVVKGGNYGWNLREGKHPFAKGPSDPRGATRTDLIDPIWEYYHDIGRSITGGHVYRGGRVPALAGHYIYGDYISGQVWALKYDEQAQQVVANRSIEAPESPGNLPIVAFGQDEQGEVYLTDAFGQIWGFAAGEGKLPLVAQDDFEKGIGRWEPFDPAQFKAKKTDKGTVLSQHEKKSQYKPPHRSPTNIALLKDVTVSDFELKARVLSTHPDYGHRDAVLVFGYQDPAHFYYVHLGKQADDHANQIFIVNEAPRTKISLTTTTGTNWDDNWHDVKIVRRVSDGTIEIYYDDMDKPVMTAKDKTFAWGRIGVGTFDDTSDWDNLQLKGIPVSGKK